mgnify:CR=1 FL=1
MDTSYGNSTKKLYSIKTLFNQRVPMRDNVELAADVYMPDTEGPFPTLLVRTPYDKLSSHDIQFRTSIVHLAEIGYATVSQDIRGRFESDGEFYPFVNEANDGHDTIEWIGRQPWCNGKIGVIGASYKGLTIWQAGQSSSKYLTSLTPRVASSNVYHNWVYTGGAFQLAFGLAWSLGVNGRTSNSPHDWMPEEIHKQKAHWHLPLIESHESIGRKVGYWSDWINHPNYDNYWHDMKPIDENYSNINVPALSSAGWFDVFLQGTINNFVGATKFSKNQLAKHNQKMLIGPWVHDLGDRGTISIVGDIDFGTNALIDIRNLEDRWHEYWLKGINNGIMDEPKIKIFVMGKNEWRESNEWPLRETQYTSYFLHSDKGANSLLGDGLLNTLPPNNEKPDIYIYDPNHPVMTIGGSTCCAEENLYAATIGPRDQRINESRPDVLVFSTPILDKEVEVTGPIKLIIYASSSAKDTDWVAKLVDVYPDGYAMNVAEGILRARYRDSWTNPVLLNPGEIYKFTVDLWSTSNCFLKGHSIRLEITSSNFPHYDRNPNTGNIFGKDDELLQAKQTIYHDKLYPSHIILPIIPN